MPARSVPLALVLGLFLGLLNVSAAVHGEVVVNGVQATFQGNTWAGGQNPVGIPGWEVQLHEIASLSPTTRRAWLYTKAHCGRATMGLHVAALRFKM